MLAIEKTISLKYIKYILVYILLKKIYGKNNNDKTYA